MRFTSTGELVAELRRLDLPDVGAGGANWVLEEIAGAGGPLDDADAFVDLWLDAEHLSDEQMGWILAHGFGPDWSTPLLQRLGDANAAGDTALASRVLDLLRITGQQAGRPPVILGAHGDSSPPLPPVVDLTPRVSSTPDEDGTGSSEPTPPPPPPASSPAPPPPAPSPAPPAPPPAGSPYPTGSPHRSASPAPRSVDAPAAEPEPDEVEADPGPTAGDETDTGEVPVTADGERDPRRFQVSRDPDEPRVVQFEFSERRDLLVLPVAGDPTLPADVIPATGLDTRWVVSSPQPLSAVDDRVRVVRFPGSEGEHWIAEFELPIPKVGDSELRRLRCDGDDHQVLDVRVYTTGFDATLLRHLMVSLVPADDAAPELDDAAVSDVRDSIDVAHHEFTTPPDDVTITVGDDFAFFKHGTSLPETELWPSAAELGSPIGTLRRTADTFRATHAAQLDAIDADELADRLEGDLDTNFLFRTLDWRFDTYEDVHVLPDHQAAWDAVASSTEALDLAFDGYTLYNTFFPEGSPLRTVLDALPAGSRINIDWPVDAGNASVPWSLMYTALPPVAGPIDANQFLGLRFRLSWSKWRRAPTSQVLGRADAAERLHFLYWEPDEIGAEAAHQREQADTFGAVHRVVPDLATVETAPARQQAISELLAPTGAAILHFYCHCIQDPGTKQSKLVFGPIQRSEEFVVSGRDFGAGRFVGEPLVFVNACDSAGAGVYEVNQLEQMFFSRGCRAFMGTEIKVPIALAARFAHVFFELLEEPLDGSRLFAGEAAAQARRYLWLNYRNIGGLFYSYIHHYGLRMEP